MLLLGVASGLSAFGMAIVIPTLAELGRVFDADLAAVQFVVSAYALGLALAQPVLGILSDRFGRRPIMLWGLGVFVVASWLCSFTTSLEGLVLGRFFQALGISVGTVTSRALVRDVCNTQQTARAMTVISASLGIAPVIAPMVGGYLSAGFGWEMNFILTAATGVVTLVWVYLRLPETRVSQPGPTTDGNTRQKIATLLGAASFLGYTLSYGFMSSAFFVFLVVGASVFEQYLNIDQETFGLIWGPLALTYVAGAMLANPLTARFGFRGTIRIGIAGLALIAALLPLTLMVFGVTVASLLVPLAGLMTLSGMISPLTLAGAVSFRPQWSGLSSGLSSSIGLGMGVVFALVAGLVYQDSIVEPIALMTLATLGTIATLMLALKGDQIQQQESIHVGK